MTALAEELATTDAERRALDALRDACGESDGPMERHGARCFLLAERLAQKLALDVDREVLLCASLLHDSGLYPAISRGGVYTVDGGLFAKQLFSELGWEPDRVELCDLAIARHHETRAQWDAGAEVELVRLADRVEVSAGLLRAGLDRAAVREIFARASRRGMYRHIGALLAPIILRRPLSLLRIFRLEN